LKDVNYPSPLNETYPSDALGNGSKIVPTRPSSLLLLNNNDGWQFSSPKQSNKRHNVVASVIKGTNRSNEQPNNNIKHQSKRLTKDEHRDGQCESYGKIENTHGAENYKRQSEFNEHTEKADNYVLVPKIQIAYCTTSNEPNSRNKRDVKSRNGRNNLHLVPTYNSSKTGSDKHLDTEITRLCPDSADKRTNKPDDKRNVWIHMDRPMKKEFPDGKKLKTVSKHVQIERIEQDKSSKEIELSILSVASKEFDEHFPVFTTWTSKTSFTIQPSNLDENHRVCIKSMAQNKLHSELKAIKQQNTDNIGASLLDRQDIVFSVPPSDDSFAPPLLLLSDENRLMPPQLCVPEPIVPIAAQYDYTTDETDGKAHSQLYSQYSLIDKEPMEYIDLDDKLTDSDSQMTCPEIVNERQACLLESDCKMSVFAVRGSYGAPCTRAKVGNMQSQESIPYTFCQNSFINSHSDFDVKTITKCYITSIALPESSSLVTKTKCESVETNIKQNQHFIKKTTVTGRNANAQGGQNVSIENVASFSMNDKTNDAPVTDPPQLSSNDFDLRKSNDTKSCNVSKSHVTSSSMSINSVTSQNQSSISSVAPRISLMSVTRGQAREIATKRRSRSLSQPGRRSLRMEIHLVTTETTTELKSILSAPHLVPGLPIPPTLCLPIHLGKTSPDALHSIPSPVNYNTTTMLTCPSLTCPSLTCPSLTCPSLTCPSLKCSSLTCPSLTCPSLTCPSLICPSLICPSFPAAEWLSNSFSNSTPDRPLTPVLTCPVSLYSSIPSSQNYSSPSLQSPSLSPIIIFNSSLMGLAMPDIPVTPKPPPSICSPLSIENPMLFSSDESNSSISVPIATGKVALLKKYEDSGKNELGEINEEIYIHPGEPTFVAIPDRQTMSTDALDITTSLLNCPDIMTNELVEYRIPTNVDVIVNKIPCQVASKFDRLGAVVIVPRMVAIVEKLSFNCVPLSEVRQTSVKPSRDTLDVPVVEVTVHQYEEIITFYKTDIIVVECNVLVANAIVTQ